MVIPEKRNVQATPKYSIGSDYFGGVDFTNSPLNVDQSRTPYAINEIPKTVGKNEKRPAWKYHTFTGATQIPEGYAINGYYEYTLDSGTYAFIHAGTKLYNWNVSANTLTEIQHKDGGIENPTSTTLTLNNAKSKIYGLNDKVFILDGKDIYVLEQIDANANSYTFYTDGTVLTTTPTSGSVGNTPKDLTITLTSEINVGLSYFEVTWRQTADIGGSSMILYKMTLK